MTRTSEKRIRETWFGLFQELYANSEPPLDFKAFVANVEKTGVCDPDWFRKHVIAKSKYVEIVDKWLKGLSKREKKGFRWDLLNYSPRFEDGVGYESTV